LGIVFFLLSPLCIATIGAVIWLFHPEIHRSWGTWIALGFFIYAVVVGLYGSLAFLRLRKEGLADDIPVAPANS